MVVCSRFSLLFLLKGNQHNDDDNDNNSLPNLDSFFLENIATFFFNKLGQQTN